MHGRKAFSLNSQYSQSSGEAKRFVESLVAAAEAGDAKATYQIFLRTHQCEQALASVTDAEMNIYAKMGLAEQHLQSVEQTQQECATLIADANLWNRPWLAMAAEQGSVEAMLMYATSPEHALGRQFNPIADPEAIIRYRARAMRYLEDAADLGSIEALGDLSRAYKNGILVASDATQSYAYDLVRARVYPALVAENLLDLDRQHLSPGQMAEARLIADEIQRRCCQ